MIVKADEDGYNEVLEGVRLKTLTHGETTHLTEVRLRKGAVVPEHQHLEEQTGYLVSGRMRFFGANGVVFAKPGDSWTFDRGVVHGAEALEDCVVVEVFSPVRRDYLELAKS